MSERWEILLTQRTTATHQNRSNVNFQRRSENPQQTHKVPQMAHIYSVTDMMPKKSDNLFYTNTSREGRGSSTVTRRSWPQPWPSLGAWSHSWVAQGRLADSCWARRRDSRRSWRWSGPWWWDTTATYGKEYTHPATASYNWLLFNVGTCTCARVHVHNVRLQRYY